MTLIYIGLAFNFLMMVGSWIAFFKIFKLKSLESYLEIENIKEDLALIARNPAAARRKLKSGQ